MKSYEEVEEKVKEMLSEKRFFHSKCVEKQCIRLAQIYGADIKKARLVGIAHDIAKEMTIEEKLQYVKQNNIKINTVEKHSPELLHASIGADICQKEFGFSQDMAEAIKNHTTGKKDMDLLSKILYIGDSSSEDRTYNEAIQLRELAETDIEKAIFQAMNLSIEQCLKKDKMIDVQTIETRNAYLESHNF